MQQVQDNEREKRSSGWLLAMAIIIISLLIYWVINEFDEQEKPQVRNGKTMQIMV
jgi:hypothetical protein